MDINASTNKQTPLTAIFSQTDTITAGPFSIQKAVGESWENAKFFINGHSVKMPAQNKLVMALLVSKSGTAIRYKDIEAEIGESGFIGNFNTRVTSIRKFIRAIPECEDYAKLIVSAHKDSLEDDSDIATAQWRFGYKLSEQTQSSVSYLKKIFSQTDNVSYGPFVVKKPAGSPWTDAKVCVDGHEIKLTEQQNLIMALLVCRAGNIVQPTQITDEVKQKATGLKVYIHKIKKAIRAIPECAHYADMIVSGNPSRGQAIRGKIDTSLANGYRLLDPKSLTHHIAYVYDPAAYSSLKTGFILVVRGEQGLQSVNYTSSKTIPKHYSDKAACAEVSCYSKALLVWKGPASDVVYYGENNPERVSQAIKRHTCALQPNNH